MVDYPMVPKQQDVLHRVLHNAWAGLLGVVSCSGYSIWDLMCSKDDRRSHTDMFELLAHSE